MTHPAIWRGFFRQHSGKAVELMQAYLHARLQAMKPEEHTIQIPEIFKGMTASERTILWQALTIDQMRDYMKYDTDMLCLYFQKRGGEYFAQIDREDPLKGRVDSVLSWHGEPVRLDHN
jgi:hypothetical protein